MTLDGAANIRDLESQYHIVLPRDEGFETLAGFVLAQLQKIPAVGRQLRVRRTPVYRRHHGRAARGEREDRDRAAPTAAPIFHRNSRDPLMLRYLLLALLYMLPVVWLVVSVVFLLIHLVPGDPIQQMLGEGAAATDWLRRVTLMASMFRSANST